MNTPFSEEQLTVSRWSLGEEGQLPWSSSLYFLPNGRIGGYSSPNEVYWNLEGSVLRIFRGNRQEMWRFNELELVEGKLRATGRFQAEPGIDARCRLQEVERRNRIVPTEEDLIGSRWSLGEEGRVPWSSSLCFLSGGSIGGYSSPNEVYWSLEQSILRIFRANRHEMWRFVEMERLDGKLQAAGSYQAEPGFDSFCWLKEVEKRAEATSSGLVPTKDYLVGSRWSLGEPEGEACSSSVYFLRNGRIGGYRGPDQAFWTLQHSVLTIFDDAHEESWRFELPTMVEGKLRAVGSFQKGDVGQKLIVLTEQSKFAGS